MGRGIGEGRGRENRVKPLPQPVPGDCESLLTGIMLSWVAGKGDKTVL